MTWKVGDLCVANHIGQCKLHYTVTLQELDYTRSKKVLLCEIFHEGRILITARIVIV